jgi:hypothetical protein
MDEERIELVVFDSMRGSSISTDSSRSNSDHIVAVID